MNKLQGKIMNESTYKIIELNGRSTGSWEEAVRNAMETVGKAF
jgi:flavin-binding protein dodecin